MSARSPTFISISNSPPRDQFRQSDGPSLRGHLPFGQSAVTRDRVTKKSCRSDRTHAVAKQFHCDRYFLAYLNAALGAVVGSAWEMFSEVQRYTKDSNRRALVQQVKDKKSGKR